MASEHKVHLLEDGNCQIKLLGWVYLRDDKKSTLIEDKGQGNLVHLPPCHRPDLTSCDTCPIHLNQNK